MKSVGESIYEFPTGLGLNRMSHWVLSLQLRCILVSERQTRFVDVEASLDKDPFPGDQKPPRKFHINLTYPPHTTLPPGAWYSKTH